MKNAVEPTDGRFTRWDSHRERRRGELCRAARRAVHQRGPDRSMDEMAAAMGTSKSIVYRYFADKSGLQAAVGIAVLDEIAHALAAAAATGADPHAQVEAMVGVYVGMLTNSPNVYRFVTQSDNQPSSMATFLSTVREYVAMPLKEILTSRGEDPALARIWAAGTVGFVRGAGEEWLEIAPADRLDPGDLARDITTWLWSGATTAIGPATPDPATPQGDKL